MTIQEIARMAGVSSAAVSRYLNQGRRSGNGSGRSSSRQITGLPNMPGRCGRSEAARSAWWYPRLIRRRFRGFCRESVRNWIRRITIFF